MNSTYFRMLLSAIFADYNAYFGDNTGSFDDLDYKINYQIKTVNLSEEVRTYMLDIDVWSKSTTRVDIIADEIEEMLNFQSKGDIATFILGTRYNADEKDLYRRTLTYEVRTY